ncbi:MAG: hypothetical protein Q8P68_00175 [Candidatus Peregrinibacteria bacterium]|nr:hypothetical protein [Candidatus Peregrinibacteria bacterium]MDZ4244611.1 hypothetical protein [Candidatus Gracilibacteria bacterium]
MNFLREFYQPIITLVFGTIGIILIMWGSNIYGKVKLAKGKNTLIKKASKRILIGNTAMALTALMAMNPRFLYPEIATVLTALRPFLESRSSFCEKFFTKIKAELLFVIIALVIGGYVMLYHVDYNIGWWQICAPLGLTLLAIGFSIGSEQNLQKIFRILMMAGGSFLTVGSAYETYFSTDLTGQIMGLAFFTLNFIFTINEIKECIKKFLRLSPTDPNADTFY